VVSHGAIEGDGVRNVIITAAVVSDRPVVRRGLQSILTGPDFTVVAAVARTAELAGLGAVDVVLLAPGEEEPVAAIAELRASTRVLLVCAPPATADVVRAIRAGVNGYLTDQAEDAVIRSAAQTVAVGGFAVSADLACVLHSQLGPHPTEPDPTPPRRPALLPSVLSPREREALCWIARGFTHAQTADRMRVSKPTVDTYVARARVKLKLGNKADLTRAAMEMDASLSPAC
jgi:DNA-binding NarL/FixJ family response regulator